MDCRMAASLTIIMPESSVLDFYGEKLMSDQEAHHGIALQDLAAPEGICFGCGAKNTQGLQLKSYWDEDGAHVIARYCPDTQFVGWPTLVYGGLLGCLVDCHSNWTAMAYHYQLEQRALTSTPQIHCVTGSLGVKFIKPTPLGVPLFLKAHVVNVVEKKTQVRCEIYANDELTVLGDSVFVRVDISVLAKACSAPVIPS